MAAGGSLCPSTVLSLFALGQDKEINQPLAVPIRGLVNKDGRLLQPVLIHLQHPGPNATVVTKLNGLEAESRTLSEGPHTSGNHCRRFGLSYIAHRSNVRIGIRACVVDRTYL